MPPKVLCLAHLQASGSQGTTTRQELSSWWVHDVPVAGAGLGGPGACATRKSLASLLGAILAGGFSTGLYPTNSAEMNKYIMNDSGANIFVVEDHATLKKMLPVIQGRNSSSKPLYTELFWWSDIWVWVTLIMIMPLSTWVCLGS